MRKQLELFWGGFLIILSSFAMADSKIPDTKPQSQTMNNQRLGELIKRIDNKATGKPGQWEFTIESKVIRVITDEKADRMRIITPIAKSEELDKKQLYRLMQANFDSALDARYSIANGLIWSAYIHPLSPLTDKEFLEGVAQVTNLAVTYGTSFSSGLLLFQGGDKGNIQRRKLIDDLLEKGLSI